MKSPGLAMLVSAMLLGLPASSSAQSAVRTVPGGSAGEASTLATREQLRTRLDSLSSVIGRADDQSSLYHALEERDRIERRLEHGDFQPGDVVQLTVRGDSSLTGRFPVRSGPELELPAVGNISLDHVLFSEADSAIGASLAVYLRHPEVQVRVLRRVAVTGGVTRPGFYDFAPSATLSEVIMAAGGPTQNAKLMNMEFRRDGQNLLAQEPPDLRSDLTLSDLGARRGDQLYLPQRGGGSSTLAVLGVLGSLAGLAVAVTRF
ncbi:MAG TPA: SLBB domain-containing protein [Gemmatimonadota bacterium]|nr:SLBB domain-containing protein [Gemmatimonadota bacterium]